MWTPLDPGRVGQPRVMSPFRSSPRTGSSAPRRVAATGATALLVLTAAACGSAADDALLDEATDEAASSAHAWPSLATEQAAADSDSESAAGNDAAVGTGKGAAVSDTDGTDEAASGGASSDGAAQAAPFSGTTGTSRSEATGPASLSVTGVRLGGHGGFDRVVYELGGEGAPGWWVEYVDEPTQDGSGQRIDVPGSAFLQVYLEGVGYPFDTGVPEYDGPRTVTAPDVQAIRGVTVAGVFEGRHMSAIGVSEVRPYRVFRLESPPRVVIDVAR
jgi:hypothetical protein